MTVLVLKHIEFPGDSWIPLFKNPPNGVVYLLVMAVVTHNTVLRTVSHPTVHPSTFICFTRRYVLTEIAMWVYPEVGI